MADIWDRIAIEETKARYCRCLDTKDWDGYLAVFTPDLVLDTTGSGGELIEGRDRAVAAVRASIGEAETAHHVHSPEVRFLDADTAEVVWAMQDRVIWPPDRARQVGYAGLTGWGHYHERYARGPDGGWLIARSRLTRLRMDMQPLEGSA